MGVTSDRSSVRARIGLGVGRANLSGAGEVLGEGGRTGSGRRLGAWAGLGGIVTGGCLGLGTTRRACWRSAAKEPGASGADAGLNGLGAEERVVGRASTGDRRARKGLHLDVVVLELRSAAKLETVEIELEPGQNCDKDLRRLAWNVPIPEEALTDPRPRIC